MMMSNASLPPSKLRSIAVIAVPLLAMLLVVLGIWMHAAHELQPPIYDALSYVVKAKNFWAAVGEHGFFNANKIEPVVRPFATVLISYPFGYSDDYRWFYFRTNALPALLLSISVFVAAGPLRSLSLGSRMSVAALSVIALAIPSVFQFAAADGVDVMGNWGFFDLALAAFGALAVALAVRPGMRVRSKAIWISLIAVLIIYTKPAGLSMMVMLAGIWLIVAGRQWLAGQASRGELLQGIAVFVLVYLGAAATLIGSEYFSLANYRYGVRSMELLHSAQVEAPGVGTVLHKLHISSGLAVVLLTIVGLIAALRARAWDLAVLTILVVMSGIWLWLGRTNADHVRYFIPFPMMAYMLVVPVLVRSVEAGWVGWIQKAAIAMGLAQFMLTVVLLYQSAPSPHLQRIAGVNLTSGQYQLEIKGGKQLAEHIARREPATAIVYYATFTPQLLAFQSELEYRRNLGMRGGNSIPSLPVDWVREHAYRLAEITQADFVVFPKRDPSILDAPSYAEIPDFGSEEVAITAWLSGLDETAGVSATDSAGIRVLEVTDRDLFHAAATEYAARHKQRPAALEKFGAPNVRTQRLLKQPVPLTFEGRHIATLGSVALMDVAGGTQVRATLLPIGKHPPGDWLVFVHQMYADGTFSDAYSPVQWAGSPVHSIAMPPAAGKVVTGYGIGVIQPQGPAGSAQFLSRQGGDWNGTRTVMACDLPGCSWPTQLP
jgi:hypothetical protein